MDLYTNASVPEFSSQLPLTEQSDTMLVDADTPTSINADIPKPIVVPRKRAAATASLRQWSMPITSSPVMAKYTNQRSEISFGEGSQLLKSMPVGLGSLILREMLTFINQDDIGGRSPLRKRERK